jgi:aldose sugar dehydrogenase
VKSYVIAVGAWRHHRLLVLAAIPLLGSPTGHGAFTNADQAMGPAGTAVTAVRSRDHDVPRLHASSPESVESIRTSAGRVLQAETVASGLDTPWDLVLAPDGSLWFTERPGHVSRIDLATGEVRRVGEIDVAESGESGLMGMAFHPDFPREPIVFFAHSYRSLGGIRNRLIRMHYRDGRLVDAQTLLDGLAGRGNHNGSRLAVGPDRLLYMTMGDAGQGDRAQDRRSLSGKILRLTLEGRPAPDNPFSNEVWSWGHRNPQGIVFAPGGTLYATEHGPSDADEVNRIVKGGNYGWPVVHGACDRPAEREFCAEHAVIEPLVEYTPTIGISGVDYYDSDRIPGWRGSLVYTSLVGQKLLRLVLRADGLAARNQERILDGEYGRLRDVLVAPDGTLYIATSNRDGRGRPAADDDRIIRIRP